MEEASSATAHGGLAAALADNLDPSGEASPGKEVVDAVDANVRVASGDGVLPEHAVTAVVGDEELTIFNLGSDPDTQAVTPPVVGDPAKGTAEPNRGDANDGASEVTDDPATLAVLVVVDVVNTTNLRAGDAGLLAEVMETGDEAADGTEVDGAAVVTTLSRPKVDVGEAAAEVDATDGEGWAGGWLGNGYCSPGVFGIEIDSLLLPGVVGLRALGVVQVAVEVTPHVTLAAEKGDLTVVEVAVADDVACAAADADGDDSGDGKRPATPPAFGNEFWLEGEMGPFPPRDMPRTPRESPRPDILKGLVTGTNSLGSYLSLTFSSRLESSSKTDRLARTRLTISEGFIPAKSKSRHLCLDLRRSVTELSTLDRASPPDAQLARFPVHCSYIFSSALTLSSKEWSVVGECLGELRFPESESEDEDEGAEGGLGGGEAGGGAGLGLGLGGGKEMGLGDVTAGGDDREESLAADDCLQGNCNWAANLGRGSERGPSFNLSLGALLGSLGRMFSGLSSNKGVPGLELSPDSFPLRTVTSIEL